MFPVFRKRFKSFRRPFKRFRKTKKSFSKRSSPFTKRKSFPGKHRRVFSKFKKPNNRTFSNRKHTTDARLFRIFPQIKKIKVTNPVKYDDVVLGNGTQIALIPTYVGGNDLTQIVSWDTSNRPAVALKDVAFWFFFYQYYCVTSCKISVRMICADINVGFSVAMRVMPYRLVVVPMLYSEWHAYFLTPTTQRLTYLMSRRYHKYATGTLVADKTPYTKWVTMFQSTKRATSRKVVNLSTPLVDAGTGTQGMSDFWGPTNWQDLGPDNSAAPTWKPDAIHNTSVQWVFGVFFDAGNSEESTAKLTPAWKVGHKIQYWINLGEPVVDDFNSIWGVPLPGEEEKQQKLKEAMLRVRKEISHDKLKDLHKMFGPANEQTDDDEDIDDDVDDLEDTALKALDELEVDK